MRRCGQRAVLGALCLLLASVPLLALDAGDDDEAAAVDRTTVVPKAPAVDKVPAADKELPQLSPEQQRAVGIQIAHPVAAKTPDRTAAIGRVLDGAALVEDSGEARAAEAAAHAAAAELKRVQELYRDGAGASQKALESAQAEYAKLQAQSTLSSARFAQRWGPLSAWSSPDRERLSGAVASGGSLLVRADLPGRHSLGELPRDAVLEVDGIEVSARVLGLMRQSVDTQSVGMLVEVPAPPPGLGPGARVPVTLLGGRQSGFLLPREAVLYDENGAYVYKRVAEKNAGSGASRYLPAKVRLLAPLADGWLVTGVDEDDDVVVRGAGVLWSLQGVGAHAAESDDD